jgi:hypothetical protein
VISTAQTSLNSVCRWQTDSQVVLLIALLLQAAETAHRCERAVYMRAVAQHPAQAAELDRCRACAKDLTQRLSALEAENAQLLVDLEKAHSLARKGLQEAMTWQQQAVRTS